MICAKAPLYFTLAGYSTDGQVGFPNLDRMKSVLVQIEEPATPAAVQWLNINLGIIDPIMREVTTQLDEGATAGRIAQVVAAL